MCLSASVPLVRLTTISSLRCWSRRPAGGWTDLSETSSRSWRDQSWRTTSPGGPARASWGWSPRTGHRLARHGCASCPSTTVDRHLGTSGLSRGCSTTTGRTSSWLTAERSRYGEVDRDECRDDAGRLCGSGSVGWLVAVAVLRRVAARARCAGLGLRCSARGRRPRPRPFGRARGGWWGDGAIDHRSRVGLRSARVYGQRAVSLSE